MTRETQGNIINNGIKQLRRKVALLGNTSGNNNWSQIIIINIYNL